MTNTEPRLSSLQQDRSRRTRQNLVETAERLWRDHGFDDVTVGRICEEAGVAKGTFYFYFPSKEDLLIELGLVGLDPTAAVVDERLAAGDRPRAVLRAAAEEMGTQTARIPKHLLRRAAEELFRSMDRFAKIRGDHPMLGQVLGRAFAEAQDRGELPAHYSAGELGAAAGWTALQAILIWTSREEADDLGELMWRRIQLVYNGAGTAPDPLR